MKVEKSTVTKLFITGAKALDPITVILEDIGPHQGKIIIECYGKSWSAYWGGMGEQTIAQFFCSCDEHYIAKNLKQGIESSIVDGDSIKDGALRQIISMRRGRMVRSRLSVDGYVLVGRSDGWSDPNLMQKVFGDEWWYQLPEKPSPAYQYLCRIIKAVQEALTSEVAELEDA